ncbi:hypothetical protein CFOL_v3_00380, partial [Cephalotus follicularis]
SSSRRRRRNPWT